MDKGAATRERVIEAAEALILQKGFAGTSLDDVLQATGLTKGAFFHHFRSKADLGRAVVERYARNDDALFRTWSVEADAASADPLERTMIFLESFERWLDGLGRPFSGCVFAAYTYERGQFSPEVMDFIRTRLNAWIRIYEEKLEALFAQRAPARPTSPRALAEMIVTLVEGGFVMANAMNDATWVQRQSRQYRDYLATLFPPV